MKANEQFFLIEVQPSFRPGRGRFWRPDSSGYTDLIERAGVYPEAVARKIKAGDSEHKLRLMPALKALRELGERMDVVEAGSTPDQVRAQMYRLRGETPPPEAEVPHADELVRRAIENVRAARDSDPTGYFDGAHDMGDGECVHCGCTYLNKSAKCPNNLPKDRPLSVASPLWARVKDLFDHGSTVSAAICRKYGFNPDEEFKP